MKTDGHKRKCRRGCRAVRKVRDNGRRSQAGLNQELVDHSPLRTDQPAPAEFPRAEPSEPQVNADLRPKVTKVTKVRRRRCRGKKGNRRNGRRTRARSKTGLVDLCPMESVETDASIIAQALPEGQQDILDNHDEVDDRRRVSHEPRTVLQQKISPIMIPAGYENSSHTINCDKIYLESGSSAHRTEQRACEIWPTLSDAEPFP